ncbi:MAG: hypothetical protein U0232_27915 [Thermomicrobiales bacterium]
MSDQQAIEAIGYLADAHDRQQLRDLFAREGRSAAFLDALIAATNRQAGRMRDRGTLAGGARWVARKSGKLFGRATRNLEQQSIRMDAEEARKRGQAG